MKTIAIPLALLFIAGQAVLVNSQGDPYAEPIIISSINGMLDITLRFEYGDFFGPHYTFSNTRLFNGRYPGPTVKIRPGDQVRILFENNLVEQPGSVKDGINVFRLPDTTNLHFHGGHVSGELPSFDTRLEIGPQDSYPYETTFPLNHMPGTHWIHPQNHGSAALQVGGGALMALIVEDEVLPADISDAPERIMVVHEIDCPILEEIRTEIGDSTFSFTCTGGPTEFRTVNGQYQPVLTITANQWERWRIVWGAWLGKNLDFHFADGSQCEMQLLAKDGIYISDYPRTITSATIPTGGRADIMVRCTAEGTYEVQDFDDQTLLTVSVSGSTTAVDLMAFSPTYPEYLKDLTDTNALGGCSCTTALTGCPSSMDFCVNDLAFDPDIYLHITAFDSVVERELFGVDRHPYHQHVYPMQIVDGVDSLPDPAENAYFQVGDWHDVLKMSFDTTNNPPTSIGGGIVTNIIDSTVPTSESITYDVVFTNNWSGTNHPPDYPSNAHWSPPLIATHSSAYTMWQAGTLASAGVQLIAESGDTTTLENELSAAGSATGDPVIGTPQFNNMQQSQDLTITVSSSRPFLSAISMIAPSPDWFAGFNNYAPNDGSVWHESFTIYSQPYDAGTDSGTTYTSTNSDTDPPVDIFEITADTSPPSSQVFVKDGDVLPMLRWTFTRSNVNPVAPRTVQGTKAPARHGQLANVLLTPRDSDTTVTVRYSASDFVGNVMLHCHILPHADTGTMSQELVVDGGSCACDAFSTPSPTPDSTPAPPTVSPSPAPSICFSEVATVEVEGKGEVKMKDLQVTDKVYAGSKGGKPFYEQIYAFGHYDTTASAEFIRIQTNSKYNTPLEMSAAHLLYVDGLSEPVRADTIQPGDSLIQTGTGIPESLVVVTKVDRVTRNGAYMPLTKDGFIIVNGVHASTYVSISDDAPEIVKRFGSLFNLSEQKLLHWWLAPYRFVCMGISHDLCQNDYYEEGISKWLVAGRYIASAGESWPFVFQMFGLCLFFSFMLACIALENILRLPRLALQVSIVLVMAQSVRSTRCKQAKTKTS